MYFYLLDTVRYIPGFSYGGNFVFRIVASYENENFLAQYLLCDYAELYEYLNYEILKWVVFAPTKIIYPLYGIIVQLH